MGRRKKDKAPTAGNLRPALRWLVRILPLAVVLVAGAQAFHTVEQFLLEDRRFQFGALPQEREPYLQVRGIVHTPREEVEEVFAGDLNKSIYLLPINERRLSMLAIDWVENATVARIWPDRIDVLVRERKPVAFIQLPAGQDNRQVALIDKQGVILQQPEKSQYDLPVLTGIQRTQSEPARAERVRTALALIADIGTHAEKVSEIDVGKADNMRVTFGIGGNAVVLMLGDRNFRRRVEHFLSHYAEIQRHLPAATTFDLRLDDRITAVDGVKAGD